LRFPVLVARPEEVMADPLDVPRPVEAGPSDFSDRLRTLRSDARVGVAVLVCVAVAAGVAWFRAGIAPAASAPSPPAASSGSSGAAATAAPSTSAITTSTTTGAIVVDVVGAVRAPGVVSLPASARVIDAIRAAGGATPGADLARLNLAAKLADGTRIAVPIVGQEPPVVDPAAVSGSAGPSTGDPAAGPGGGVAATVNVNTATAVQLEDLPGIGPTLAAAIVQERERNGPFRTVEDLNRVPGIGDGRLSQLRDLVTV
jgi:competence protein ComEA